MSTIYAYVESIFNKLPPSREMLQLKNEMLANMEDKYNDLVTEGLSEHEAIGQVLAEFGDISEIIEAYNLDFEESERNDPNVLSLSKNEAEAYFFHRQKYALAIATGVFLCIISVAFLFLTLTIRSFFFSAEIGRAHV